MLTIGIRLGNRRKSKTRQMCLVFLFNKFLEILKQSKGWCVLLLNMTTKYNIVWLKRDLRLTDHAPLHYCAQGAEATILWYNFEPSLMGDPHYSDRHFQFIYDSLADINEKLISFNTQLLVTYGDTIDSLNCLLKQVEVKTILSHQETGLSITYGRDQEVALWCQLMEVEWKEFQSNGIQRGRSNRNSWVQDWYDYMNSPQHAYGLNQISWIPTDELNALRICFEHYWRIGNNERFQRGGQSEAFQTMYSFFDRRVSGYRNNISKPSTSPQHCSRLSPYIAWGNLSIRQVYQALQDALDRNYATSDIESMASRLQWHCHHIQKFEMECDMEFRSVNRAFEKLEKPLNKSYQEAWKTGHTGFPLVDACMRCLNHTGYINFRMRAMLVSFFTHHLWQPWQDAAQHLARQFLDFEPGIHFSQIQKHAAETGTNVIRIYNPVKESYDHDPQGIFIKDWVPELRSLPAPYLHEPWNLTANQQEIYGFKCGQDYPEKIVDIEKADRYARQTLSEFSKRTDVQKEAERIIRKQTNEAANVAGIIS